MSDSQTPAIKDSIILVIYVDTVPIQAAVNIKDWSKLGEELGAVCNAVALAALQAKVKSLTGE